MKTLRLYIATAIVVSGLFMISPAMAKETQPVYGQDQSISSLAPEPTNQGVTYGNTTLTPISDITPSRALSAGDQNLNGNGNGNGGVGNGNGNGNADHLPINNGLVFLLIAGVAIGIKLSMNGSRKIAYQ